MHLSCRILAFALLATVARVQQPAATPTLDQLLTGAHNNFLAYLSTVPNLIAEEHIVSILHGGYGATVRTGGGTTNSIFRMRRIEPGDNSVSHPTLPEISSV